MKKIKHARMQTRMWYVNLVNIHFLDWQEIFNAEVVFREDCTSDEFVDVILGNRVYMPCLYVSRGRLCMTCLLFVSL